MTDLRERRIALHHHLQFHVGVGFAAEFGALPGVRPDGVGREGDAIRPALHHVAFAPQARRPEAVDHVRGGHGEAHRTADRQV